MIIVPAVVAFVPPLAASVVVSRDAHLMVCALTSAFVWLLSITASSSLILCIPDSLLWMRMVVAVCGQEAGRFCLAPIYDRYSSSAKGDWWNSAVASGVGFGTIHVLVVYGTMFDERQTTVAQAAIALIFANLDVVFTCLVFSKSRGSRPFVLIAHLLASAATTYAPQFSLPPVILLLFSSIFFLWRQRSRSNFSRRDTSDNTSERRKASGAPSHEEDDDEEVHTLTTAAQRETDETGVESGQGDVTDCAMQVSELERQLETLASLLDSERPDRRPLWRLKIDELRHETNFLKNDLRRFEMARQTAYQRDQLFHRRSVASTDAVQDLTAEGDSLKRSGSQLDELMESGRATMSSLAMQRERLKATHRNALSMINTLGLSNSVMRMIQSRQKNDRYIVYAGMFLCLLVFGVCVWWRRRSS